MRRRGAVGIAHRHIDDVFSAPPRRHLEFARNIENIRRQALDARKRTHDDPYWENGRWKYKLESRMPITQVALQQTRLSSVKTRLTANSASLNDATLLRS